MHVFRVLAALAFGALVGALSINPAVGLARDLVGDAAAPRLALAAVPLVTGAVAALIALLVLPVKATR